MEAFYQELKRQILDMIEKKETMHINYSGVIRPNGILLEDINKYLDKNIFNL